ncbi:MAG: peroxiredoxin family protein [Candidatus Hydrogenedentes bacterium]|nr:peroxiredoxin family protein [Candidatus Hydrogenedentota bacterium]
MFIRIAICVIFALAVMPVAAIAQDSSSTLKVGDAAPDFDIPEQKAVEGAPKKLSDLKGKKNVLVAFYPKADTPGCTKQMCGYRDDISKLQSADTEVIAISVDQQMDSEKFQEKFKLPFPVVGDPQRKTIDAYGVPLKEYSGNKFAQRSVFVVDKEGKVQYIDLDYKVVEDKDALYKKIESLNGGAEKPAEGEKKEA